ncbi:MAG: hypothetical protein WBA83_16700 [Burkholderiaceae bacterium]
MTTYTIPESLASAYKGAGWALAAVLDGRVVALRYIQAAAPSIADQLDGQHAEFFMKQWLDTAEARVIVRELQALGKISVGICSNREFIEL